LFDNERSCDVTPGGREAPSPHPLARELAERLRESRVGCRVLLLGIGSGRNVAPLLDAGLRVDAIESDPARALAATTQFAGNGRVRVACAKAPDLIPFGGTYDAALSTHALLHGTPQSIAATIGALCARLVAGAPFYATLGSKNDPRFGTGERLGAATFAPTNGDERGVAHTYFDARSARVLLRDVSIDTLDEVGGGEHVGRWAHPTGSDTIVHWFVRGHRN